MPQSTGRVGLEPGNNVSVYIPPNVQIVTPGSTVTYGPWVQLQPGDALPAAPVIIEMAGPATFQAANQVVYRPVTIG